MKKIRLLKAKTHVSLIADGVRPSGTLVADQLCDRRHTKTKLFDDLAQVQRGLPQLSAAQLKSAIAEGRR